MILQESSQDIANYAKLQKSKLQNMKDQLDILLRKKYRLELEIRSLKSSIQSKRTNSEKTLKLKLSAESNLEPLPKNDQVTLYKEYPDLYQVLTEFDSTVSDVDQYLQEILDLEY